MDDRIELLSAVALTRDLEEKSLVRGQVGTVVELLDDGVFEVEFADGEGETYATAAVASEHLMVLRYRPARAA